MHFTDIFVKRPVLATVVSLLILLAGLQAVFSLPIRQFPEVADTKIEITTAYAGANADQIKGFITTPLQQAVASTEGVDTIESSSGQSLSTITMLLFDTSCNVTTSGDCPLIHSADFRGDGFLNSVLN